MNSMSDKKTIFIYICALLAGLLLIIFSKSAELLETVVRILGAALAIPSLVVGVHTVLNKPAEGEAPDRYKVPTLIACFGCAVLGLTMIFAAGAFVNILRWVFAFLLVASGLQQIIMLLLIRRTAKLSIWFYLVPTLVVVAGVVLATVSLQQIEEVVALITGISLLAAGVNGIIGFFARRKVEKQVNAAISAGNVIEVEPIE